MNKLITFLQEIIMQAGNIKIYILFDLRPGTTFEFCSPIILYTLTFVTQCGVDKCNGSHHSIKQWQGIEGITFCLVHP